MDQFNLEKRLLSCLAVRGPGLFVKDFLLAYKREGVTEGSLKVILRGLILEGLVEQLGQYLWLTKKGALRAKKD
jgi:hypothetical protein